LLAALRFVFCEGAPEDADDGAAFEQGQVEWDARDITGDKANDSAIFPNVAPWVASSIIK